MTITQPQFDKKIGDLQGQIDMMQQGDAVFKGYVQRQLETIVTTMTTKEDLYSMEARLMGKMATKQDLDKVEGNLDRVEGNLAKLTALVQKIADKIGVST